MIVLPLAGTDRLTDANLLLPSSFQLLLFMVQLLFDQLSFGSLFTDFVKEECKMLHVLSRS
jgi:hypothetical protein